MKPIILTLLILFFSHIFSQNVNYPEVGQIAPEIHLEKILNYNSNQDISINEFKNKKIVILEFWATWCAPCIPAMKHLDSLQNEFKEDLIVIPITLESPEKIKEYLKKSKISLLVGIDSDSSCFKTYDPQTIPHSVVIDKKGIIVGITNPSEITKEKIKSLIEGKSVHFKPKRRLKKLEPEEKEISSDIIFYVKFRKSSEDEPQFFKTYPNGNRITGSHLTIPLLLQIAFRLPSNKRIIFEVKDPSKYKFENAEKYYFDLVVPEFKKNEIYDIMIDILKKSLPIKFRLEKRKMKVKVLKLAEKGKLRPSNSSNLREQFFRGPEFHGKNITLDVFAKYLENFSKYPVVDGTGLKGTFDIDFKWQYEDINSFYRELKKLGFKLNIENREIDVLVIKE